MASIQSVAAKCISEARDGIAWIALYKVGRGWEAECFWPECDADGNDFKFEDPDDIESIHAILEQDENAIFVNGYYNNLGAVEEMTVKSLAEHLLWQYGLQHSLLSAVVSGGKRDVVLAYAIAYREQDGTDFNGAPYIQDGYESPEDALASAKIFEKNAGIRDTVIFRIPEEDERDEVISWAYVEAHKVVV